MAVQNLLTPVFLNFLIKDSAPKMDYSIGALHNP